MKKKDCGERICCDRGEDCLRMARKKSAQENTIQVRVRWRSLRKQWVAKIIFFSFILISVLCVWFDEDRCKYHRVEV